eukprot:4422275-Pyramimonas_sp.AAC.1
MSDTSYKIRKTTKLTAMLLPAQTATANTTTTTPAPVPTPKPHRLFSLLPCALSIPLCFFPKRGNWGGE